MVCPQPRTASRKKGGTGSTSSWEPQKGYREEGGLSFNALGVGHSRAVAPKAEIAKGSLGELAHLGLP